MFGAKMIPRKPNGGSTDSPSGALPPEFLDTEIISDPLNGLIRISPFEKRIICCPEFQRLRKIKQLGFANFVYPGAEYSRFVHSLGACHQAKNIVDTVNENLRNVPRYRQWRIHGRSRKEDSDPDYRAVAICAFERVIIATAALLHDLSHGPFSHEIEGILDNDNKPSIPDHDNFRDNPALFLYLFDKEVSQLAQILDYFNAKFAAALMEVCAAFANGTPAPACRSGIKALHDSKILTDAGNIRIGPRSPLNERGTGKRVKFNELPLLPVLIFEILLFEKQDEWLSPSEQRQIRQTNGAGNDYGVIVRTDWAEAEILWQPLPGWFRAYRKDIIGNTICADLIDYVGRDGYHTGIVSAMDLKFLDRMLIARSTLPPIGPDGRSMAKQPANMLAYKSIPVSCEHIVFDIYDHKRGFIRQSVLTEILAYLQGRYLLCERVYVHRVVEAARSMLQEAVGILCAINRDGDPTRPLLSIRDLHPLDRHGAGIPTAPIGDEGLLAWIRALPTLEESTYEQNRSKIDKAIELATMLVERRVFREAIIYDGIHGFDSPGQLAGAKENCRALEAALLTNVKWRPELHNTLEDIEGTLESKLASQVWNNSRFQPKTSCLLSVRKWGKRYKPPLVLVARPYREKAVQHSGLDIEPLLDCEDPPNIKKQLDALKDSYDGLWKVYLFVHPIYHDSSFIDAHERIQDLLGEFAAEHTGSRWRNAIDFTQLLREPIDNVLLLAETQLVAQRIEQREWDLPWIAESVVSLFKPLTTRDVENLTALRLYCESFVDEVKKFPAEKQAAIGRQLIKVTTYAPKRPFIVNRFSAEQIDRRLRTILDKARGVDEQAVDE